MPTNLLVWNVQFFTCNKISMNNTDWYEYVDTDGNKADGNFTALMCLDYIVSNIKLADAHIFVLIENLSSQGTMGSLAGGNGAIGSLLMLDRIRGATLNRNWMLVPPLKAVNKLQTERKEGGFVALVKEGAYTECISVYYRSDLMTFIGPYVWPQTNNNDSPVKVAQRDTGQATQAYPDVWDGAYPPGNHFAGQFEYFTDAPNRTGQLLFPDGGCRRPFLTQFREAGPGGRKISLASVHYPPKAIPAGLAFATTLRYFSNQATYNIQPDEVVLVAGDFNLDYLTIKPADWNRLYNTAANNGFTLALDQRRGNDWPTMLKRRRQTTPTNYLKNQGLDNVAIRYGGGVLPFTVNVFDRVNRTAPSMMYTPMAAIQAIPNPRLRDTVFQLYQNYYYMGPVPGVSDHLPVYLQF